jgi:septum formation protein
MSPRLILASQSAQRKILLETLGIDFKIMPADIDEKSIQHQSFTERARLIALKKVEKIATEHPKAIIIGADTFSELDGVALEKPESLQEAKKMIRMQSGNWMKTHTGLVLYDGQTGHTDSQIITTQYKFRPLSDSEIEYYVSNNSVMNWSAGFSPAYHAGSALVAEVKGSLTAFSHGLPMEKSCLF